MIFSGIECFEGTFRLKVKDDSYLYLVSHRRVANVFQEPIKKDLDRLEKQQILVPLGMDETLEWCKIFVLFPKANGGRVVP